MRATERLIPNRGREPGAFFDYAASVHDNPPRAFAFLHGHAAISWHTSCEAVFSRILLYYEALATNSATVPHLDKHMMSLTSKPHGENKGIKHVDGIGLVHGLTTAADPVKFYLSETDTTFHQLENRTKKERTKCSPGCIKNTTKLFSKLQRIDYYNRNLAKPTGG